MELNKEILLKFNNNKNKYYDEAAIELKIIELECKLKITLSKSEKFLYEQIDIQKQLLSNLQNLRLIDYVKKTNSK